MYYIMTMKRGSKINISHNIAVSIKTHKYQLKFKRQQRAVWLGHNQLSPLIYANRIVTTTPNGK